MTEKVDGIRIKIKFLESRSYDQVYEEFEVEAILYPDGQWKLEPEQRGKFWDLSPYGVSTYITKKTEFGYEMIRVENEKVIKDLEPTEAVTEELKALYRYRDFCESRITRAEVELRRLTSKQKN